MLAPPWLKIPAEGYGGVELVIETLACSLIKQGVEVEIFGVAGTKIDGVKVHAVTAREEFPSILKPMYDFSLPVPTAHVLKAIEMIKADGGFDIIHDHNYFIGPAIFKHIAGQDGIPPVVHTIHGPPLTTEAMIKDGVPDNREFWRSIAGGRGYLVSISDAMRRDMPKELEKNMAATIHNAIDLSAYTFGGRDVKKKYFVTMARFSEEKGQHIAARICARRNYRLRMAGTVAAISSPRKLLVELANPLSKYRSDRDFKYYSDKVLPYVLAGPRVTFLGGIGGKKKMKILSQASALLFPINWEEPFGMAVIDALACGTPVVAMNRGAMPEIIDHGVNGFLANDEKEFAEYMKRVGEIDPEACRQSVEKKFNADLMAERYVKAYQKVIKNTAKNN